MNQLHVDGLTRTQIDSRKSGGPARDESTAQLIRAPARRNVHETRRLVARSLYTCARKSLAPSHCYWD